MTEQELQDVLQQIVDLATAIGWQVAGAQQKDGGLVGMFIGHPDWIRARLGAPSKDPH